MKVEEKNKKQWGPIIFVSLLSLLGALAIFTLGPPSSHYFEQQQLNESKRAAELGLASIQEITQEKLVHRYIAAYQTRNCDEVIDCTLWVKERIQTINAQFGTDSEQLKQAQLELCEQLFSKDDNGSRMDILGLDDQYLMGPLSIFTLLIADSGRKNLEKPVLERVWVEFVYSNPKTAPKTQNGATPIHSLLAGINISDDRLILKGSTRGCWEIDISSISTKW